jgi:hypothetical protein
LWLGFCFSTALRLKRQDNPSLSPIDMYNKAQNVGLAFRGRVYTTEYVLIEVATFFCDSLNRDVFLSLLEALQADPLVTVIASSSKL